MKRSEINTIIKESLEFIKSMNFALPPFAEWSVDDWSKKGSECSEIIDNELGWDITDFGSGNFSKTGLTLITLRNGSLKNPKYLKPYAEKIMVVRENQVTPLHYHYLKYEDIINRGGGNLIIQLYNKTEDDRLSDTNVKVSIDGVERVIRSGETIVLKPGESICMFAGLYHKFWGESGGGMVLVGEVSKVNDDNIDNHFLEPVGRFPSIEEDEAPKWLLCNEYSKYIKK
ncbi:MAG: D-lyxose/D-mannose family sugar isomerase [Clostridiales bacterium]|nr:D-lyxose/D-mannose family sugar isomerase [Clostridiales bacterium]